MPRKKKRAVRTAGLPPGSLVHVGERKASETTVSVFDYTPSELVERQVTRLEDLAPYKTRDSVTWIRVIGLHEVHVLEKLGDIFGLHPLILEDILDTNQRPKMEDLGDYLFVVVKILSYDEATHEIATDQLSLVLGPRFVISFEERNTGLFAPIAERIRLAQGRVRTMGPDYLCYRLLDAVVDSYFVVLERIEDRLEVLEEEVVHAPGPQTLNAVHHLKRSMIQLRKAMWPLREVAGALERRESPLIAESTAVFLRDVYDHTVQIIDTVETFRDVLSGMLDIYLSSVSNRLNEVMKVLTIIATIFMPMSFLASTYGMNFKYFPEIQWRWGYPTYWAVILAIAGTMLWLFRRRKWL